MDGTEKEKEKRGAILSWRVQLHPQFSLILPLFLSCSMHCILQATVRRSFSTGRLVPTEKWKIGGGERSNRALFCSVLSAAEAPEEEEEEEGRRCCCPPAPSLHGRRRRRRR